jgi:hypothetical protein
MIFWVGAVYSAFLTGCPAGTKTSADLTVKVNVDACSEMKNDPRSTSDVAALSCPIEAGGTVRVLFPRKDLWSLKTQIEDASPGK